MGSWNSRLIDSSEDLPSLVRAHASELSSPARPGRPARIIPPRWRIDFQRYKLTSWNFLECTNVTIHVIEGSCVDMDKNWTKAWHWLNIKITFACAWSKAIFCRLNVQVGWIIYLNYSFEWFEFINEYWLDPKVAWAVPTALATEWQVLQPSAAMKLRLGQQRPLCRRKTWGEADVTTLVSVARIHFSTALRSGAWIRPMSKLWVWETQDSPTSIVFSVGYLTQGQIMIHRNLPISNWLPRVSRLQFAFCPPKFAGGRHTSCAESKPWDIPKLWTEQTSSSCEFGNSLSMFIRDVNVCSSTKNCSWISLGFPHLLWNHSPNATSGRTLLGGRGRRWKSWCLDMAMQRGPAVIGKGLKRLHAMESFSMVFSWCSPGVLLQQMSHFNPFQHASTIAESSSSSPVVLNVLQFVRHWPTQEPSIVFPLVSCVWYQLLTGALLCHEEMSKEEMCNTNMKGQH